MNIFNSTETTPTNVPTITAEALLRPWIGEMEDLYKRINSDEFFDSSDVKLKILARMILLLLNTVLLTRGKS